MVRGSMHTQFCWLRLHACLTVDSHARIVGYTFVWCGLSLHDGVHTNVLVRARSVYVALHESAVNEPAG